MAGRINSHMIHIPLHHAGNGIDFADSVDFISEKFYPNGSPGPIGRVNFQGIPPDTEFIAGEIQIVSLVTNLRQFA